MLKERDTNAFSYLYDNYGGALKGLILTFVPDDEVANSVLHDSFIKIWNQFESFSGGKGRLFTWMAAIARNTAIDTLRSKDWKNSRKNNPITEATNLSGDTQSLNVDVIDIRKLVNILSEDHKRILEMCYFEGYTQADVAESTGIPLGTVKTKLRKALQELRSYIKGK